MKTAETWVAENSQVGDRLDLINGVDDCEAFVEAIQKDAISTDTRTDSEKAEAARTMVAMILNRTPFRLKLVQDFSQEDGLMFSIEQDLSYEPFEVTTVESEAAPKEAPKGEGE